MRCFNGEFNAVWCCRNFDEPACWGRASEGGGRPFAEGCCTPEMRALATQVSTAEASQKRAVAGASRCAEGGRSIRLHGFRIQSFDFPVGKAPREHKALRMGSERRSERCEPGRAPGPALLYRRLRDSGVPLTGRVVNLGAGSWQDAAWAVTAANNLSGVFLDPDGPPPTEEMSPALRRLRESSDGVRFLQAAATPATLCDLLSQGGIECGDGDDQRSRLDFLKVDTDGCDCQLVAVAVAALRPLVLWLEINMSVPPPLRFVRHFHPEWYSEFARWRLGGLTFSTFGCSLSAAVAELGLRGYSLYALVDNQDAVFVHRSVAAAAGGANVDELYCYRRAVHGAIVFVPPPIIAEWLSAPPEEALANAWCNFTAYHEMLGISHMPFALSLR